VPMAWVLVALVLAASRPPPEPEPKPWTLEAFTAAAQAADPRALAAASEAVRLRAVEAGARAQRWPVLAWTVSADGPVPQLVNDPNALDRVQPSSRLRTGDWGGVGVHGHVGATLDWPVWTFGRAAARDEAAARGAEVGAGAAQAARARAARDAAQIFWAWQLARRSIAALDDLERQLAGARERVEELAARRSVQASKQDVAELDVVRAEIAARRADAAGARDLAADSARVAANVPADAPFAFVAVPLDPPQLALLPAARYAEAALAQRPDLAAAREAVRAREALAEEKRRARYPELAVVGFADLNWTGSATPQTNPFAWDPWNRLWGGVGLALRGTLELERSGAEVAQGEAEVQRARADAEVAARTARLEVMRAHAALRSAIERAARMRDEEAAARRWLAQAEIAFDEGSAGAQAVLLAALAAARAGAERLSAAHDAQLALADLSLAVGEDPRAVGAR
jgi:outer membrane protein TolC